MYSVGYFTEHFNSSETITQFAIVESTIKWTDAEIARLIHVIFDKFWTTRMNILCGNSLGSKTKRRCTYVHLKNFILVAFRVVCTGYQDGMI